MKVLLDHTTVDSALRFLSGAEASRRHDDGWCLRDLNDFACLSTLVDALLYFEELFTVPPGWVHADASLQPIVVPPDHGMDALRRQVRDLPADLFDPHDLVRTASATADQLIRDCGLAPVQLARGRYEVRYAPDGSRAAYLDHNVTPEDLRTSLTRSLMYVLAHERLGTRVGWTETSLWLSPDRTLITRYYGGSTNVEQFVAQQQRFKVLLGGNLMELVPTSPNLTLLLLQARHEGCQHFTVFLAERLEELRNASDVAGLRKLFHDSLNRTAEAGDLNDWATHGRLWENALVAVGLLPGVGGILQVLLTWTQDYVRQGVADLTAWDRSTRTFVRSVLSECRNLQVARVRDTVNHAFALGGYDESSKRGPYETLDYNINLFTRILRNERAILGFERADVHSAFPTPQPDSDW